MILHEVENNELSESFLKDNGKKFGDDCVKVLRLLYKGMKLTAKEVNDLLNMADGGRRLRDIFAARNDCKKAVRYKDPESKKGMIGMEYWLDIPKRPTKTEIMEKWKQKGDSAFTQLELVKNKL